MDKIALDIFILQLLGIKVKRLRAGINKARALFHHNARTPLLLIVRLREPLQVPGHRSLLAHAHSHLGGNRGIV